MAEVINMPRLSDTMEEGVVAKWLKQKGEKVEEGEILAEIETDKATMEFESFHNGTLLYIGIEEGEAAPVDSLLAIIGEEDEDIEGLIKEAKSAEKEEKSDDKTEEKEEAKETSDKATKEETSKEGEMPDGVEVVKMPRLSDTMEEGTVAQWLKQEGDEVEEGDILAEIETDKATMEFESFYSGTLLYIGVKEGETSPVEELLAIIGPKGTDVSGIVNQAKSGESSKKSSAKANEEEETESATTAKESEHEESDVQHTNSEGGRIFASPLAKKMAQEKDIDLANVKGSGENGRIVKKDIENYKPSQKATVQKEQPSKTQQPEKVPASPVEVYTPAGEENFEEVKNSQMRKTIAKRLAESKFDAPHYYLTIELDMDKAMTARKQINEMPDTKISINDMAIKATAMALRKHPQVNSQWKGDVTAIAKHIHIGVAVAVEEGLVVPVLEFADQMPMTAINAKVKNLAGKARDKKLQPKEMEGSTFTVSNLGMFGIVEFTSIINQPNSAILSIGTIVEKPVVRNGEIQVGNTMKVTLACDHRTVDGATGAKFLQTFKTYMENPVTMLA